MKDCRRSKANLFIRFCTLAVPLGFADLLFRLGTPTLVSILAVPAAYLILGMVVESHEESQEPILKESCQCERHAGDRDAQAYARNSESDAPQTYIREKGKAKTQRLPSIGTLIYPDNPQYSIERMVLYPECIRAIEAGINQILKQKEIEEIFAVSTIQPQTNKCSMNFHGLPGVGKTMGAMAVARHVNKPVLKVDYSKVANKFVGQTQKNIKTMFSEARAFGAILLFDEADALVAKRLAADDSVNSRYYNQEVDTFMQELSDHDGIVLFTTNKYENYDEAFVRRIVDNIKFDLPNKEMRAKIFQSHFTKPERLKSVDFIRCGELSEGFGGGDILNVVLKSISASSQVSADKNDWYITQSIVDEQIASIAKAKREQSGKTGRRLGLV
jgi:hypothetical protein